MFNIKFQSMSLCRWFRLAGYGLFSCLLGVCWLSLILSDVDPPTQAEAQDRQSSRALATSPVIIDHTSVNQYVVIPDYWIGEVRKMLINYVGESHSRGLAYGLQLLAEQDSRFAAEVMWTGAPEAPTDEHLGILMTRWTGASWYPFGGEEDTWTHQDAINGLNNHLTYSATQANTVDAFAFAWCWDMVWQANCDMDGWAGRVYTDFAQTTYTDHWDISTTSPNLNDYLSAWDGYAQNHPNIAMLYTTGPADRTASCEAYQVWLKNDAIREWVKNSADRYLFDYADILSHNDAGEVYTVIWDGHIFPSLHPDYRGEYDGGEGSGHINEAGCLRLGKAMWALLARIAGWSTTKQADFNKDGSVDLADYLHLQECSKGPGQSPGQTECEDSDLDGDSDVDMCDFGAFLESFGDGG